MVALRQLGEQLAHVHRVSDPAIGSKVDRALRWRFGASALLGRGSRCCGGFGLLFFTLVDELCRFVACSVRGDTAPDLALRVACRCDSVGSACALRSGGGGRVTGLGGASGRRRHARSALLAFTSRGHAPRACRRKRVAHAATHTWRKSKRSRESGTVW